MTFTSTPGVADDPSSARNAIKGGFSTDADRLLRDGGHRDPAAARAATPCLAWQGWPTVRHRGIRRRGIPTGGRRSGRLRLLGPVVLDLALGGNSSRLPRSGPGAIPGRERVDASDAARVRADAVRASHPIRAPHRRRMLRGGAVAPSIRRAPGAYAGAGADRRQLLFARPRARA